LDCYYCIVNMPGVHVREICVLDVADDAGARAALRDVADRWAGFDTICLYQGERVVEVLTNPAHGFAADDRPLLSMLTQDMAA
jgi:hypothetical protein